LHGFIRGIRDNKKPQPWHGHLARATTGGTTVLHPQKAVVSNRSPQDASRRSEKNFFIPCFCRPFSYNAGTDKTVLKPFFHRHYEVKKDGKAAFFVILKFQK